MSEIKSVLIYGVGLIGGSIAALIQEKHPNITVYGLSRRQAAIDHAQAQGMIHSGTTELAELPSDIDLAFICTPIDLVPEHINAVAAHCQADTIITDVSSVKAQIVNADIRLKEGQSFIPGHPMAGSDQMGVEHANADIMKAATYILVPQEHAKYGIFKSFLTGLGFQVIERTAAAHDGQVALASHLPYIVATLPVSLLLDLPDADIEQIKPVLASGFRDTTRVAGSDPEWGVAVAKANREALLVALEGVSLSIQKLKTAIHDQNEEELRKYFKAIKTVKDNL